ncbi:MAG: hypothetical protein HY275_01385 [Gemmatimonadetes bacterium]|nr:hypothetical protein [Gemmatimonadota bacterium]
MRITTLPLDEWLATEAPQATPRVEAAALDEEDRARVVGSYRGLPTFRTGRMRYRRRASDGAGAAHVLDAASGLVYLVV